MHSKEAEVLVIGAGVSGLTAASVLSASGIEVRLIEGRDRIGGRILTVHPEGHLPAELGAEFIHGRPQEIWDIVRQTHWKTHEVDGDEWHREAGRLRTGGEAFSAMEKVFKEMKREKQDRSFADFLLRSCAVCDGDDRVWARQFVSGFHAADPEQVGVQWLIRSMKADEEIEGDRAFRLLDGYDELPSHLLAALPANVDLQTIVREIAWQKGRVTAKATSGDQETEYRARAAVITLPLSILKLTRPDAVRFDPEIDAKRRIASKMQMGSAARVVIDFRSRFWDGILADRGKTLVDMSFLFSHEEFFPTWWSSMPDKSARLTGWTGGPAAHRLSGLEPEAVCQTAVSDLTRILGLQTGEVENQVESWYAHNWDTDPFSRGAYSYGCVGGADASEELSQPVVRTLFFAGEHCDTSGHNGTVHGAMASGRNAAYQVLRTLKG